MKPSSQEPPIFGLALYSVKMSLNFQACFGCKEGNRAGTWKETKL